MTVVYLNHQSSNPPHLNFKCLFLLFNLIFSDEINHLVRSKLDKRQQEKKMAKSKTAVSTPAFEAEQQTQWGKRNMQWSNIAELEIHDTESRTPDVALPVAATGGNL